MPGERPPPRRPDPSGPAPSAGESTRVRFGSLEVPKQLIEAHRSGNLVVFVGAGASVDPPSGLPLFGDLARGVMDDVCAGESDFADLAPDRILGDLDAMEDVDVHALVVQRITVAGSVPNATHTAIAALARSGPAIRIVTTNYDGHLSTALGSVAEYHGPALPLGDDFEGLVYLHGRANTSESHRLVATDRDFGRAYISKGWAARFLDRMFATYTVLFIGYSHEDVVMRYLARSLGPDAHRYSLTRSPEDRKWLSLGIEPLGYSSCDGTHAALPLALDKWAKHASSTRLDQRQQMRALLARGPAWLGDDAEYLESVLEDPDRATFFAEFANGHEWLEWASTKPVFRQLHDRAAAAPTSIHWIIANWYVTRYVTNPDHADSALAATRDAGGYLGPVLWGTLVQALAASDQPLPEALRPWVALLIRDDPVGPMSVLGPGHLALILHRCRWPADRELALSLLDHLSEPLATFDPWSVHLPGRPAFAIFTRVSHEMLHDAWTQVLRPHRAEIATRVMILVERHLRTAHVLTTSGNPLARGDAVSSSRDAIEDHPQNSPPGDCAVLIDAARDCLETLIRQAHPEASRYCDAWLASDVPILQRLAVHGWAERSDVDPSAKIEMLMERDLLYDIVLKHEVYRLIEIALAEADPDVGDRLVHQALVAQTDPPLRPYERFNLLVWICQCDTTLASASEALADLRKEHPEFVPRDHPDLDVWTTHGTGLVDWPCTMPELVAKLDNDPQAAIAELVGYAHARRPERPSWEGTLELVCNTAREHPAAGLQLLEGAQTGPGDLIGAVLEGWAAMQSPMAEDLAQRAVDLVGSLERPAPAAAVAQLLGANGSGASSVVWARLPDARKLAETAWNTLVAEPSAPEASPAGLSPAGLVTDFWLRVIEYEHDTASEPWAGLPDDHAQRLELLLATPGSSGTAAKVVLGRSFDVIHHLDPIWAGEKILPLFGWEDHRLAQRVWQEYLGRGAWSKDGLRAALLDRLIETAKYTRELPQDSEDKLYDVCSLIAFDTTVLPAKWALRLVASLPSTARAGWHRALDTRLGELEAAGAYAQWDRWLRDHWDERLAGKPRTLTVDETGPMVGWVFRLGHRADEGVERILRTPISITLSELMDALMALASSELDQVPAAARAKLVAHLLAGHAPPAWFPVHLREVVNKLKSEDADVAPIICQALRLGWSEAGSWLPG